MDRTDRDPLRVFIDNPEAAPSLTRAELDDGWRRSGDPIAMAAALAHVGDRRAMAQAAAACVRGVEGLATRVKELVDGALSSIDGWLARGTLDEAADAAADALAAAWAHPESDVDGALLEAAGCALELASLPKDVGALLPAEALEEAIAACVAAIELADPATVDGPAAARVADVLREALPTLPRAATSGVD
jgi:hypothetical protein